MPRTDEHLPTLGSAPQRSEPASEADTPAGGSRTTRWGKRVGAIGFLFFLVKGLLWLLIPALILAWQWVRSL
jgi:hypothetical protein